MAADAGTSDGTAERAAAELEGFVMKRTSGEQERAEPLGALSRPDRLKPVAAGLSLYKPWLKGSRDIQSDDECPSQGSMLRFSRG